MVDVELVLLVRRGRRRTSFRRHHHRSSSHPSSSWCSSPSSSNVLLLSERSPPPRRIRRRSRHARNSLVLPLGRGHHLCDRREQVGLILVDHLKSSWVVGVGTMLRWETSGFEEVGEVWVGRGEGKTGGGLTTLVVVLVVEGGGGRGGRKTWVLAVEVRGGVGEGRGGGGALLREVGVGRSLVVWEPSRRRLRLGLLKVLLLSLKSLSHERSLDA